MRPAPRQAAQTNCLASMTDCGRGAGGLPITTSRLRPLAWRQRQAAKTMWNIALHQPRWRRVGKLEAVAGNIFPRTITGRARRLRAWGSDRAELSCLISFFKATSKRRWWRLNVARRCLSGREAGDRVFPAVFWRKKYAPALARPGLPSRRLSPRNWAEYPGQINMGSLSWRRHGSSPTGAVGRRESPSVPTSWRGNVFGLEKPFCSIEALEFIRSRRSTAGS